MQSQQAARRTPRVCPCPSRLTAREEARRDCVDVDVARLQLRGEIARQVADGRLGC